MKEKEASMKGKLSLSLSDFLDRRLKRTSVNPRTVQGKLTPFSPPLGSFTTRDGNGGPVVKEEVGEKGKVTTCSKLIFEQFKSKGAEIGDSVWSSSVEVENSEIDSVAESRKRRNPFEGGNENNSVGKNVAVIGGESKLRRQWQNEKSPCSKKQRPLYNHYASGSGWWDCNMEGIDNDEVGFSEVWEGVGSSSLGGIGWH